MMSLNSILLGALLCLGWCQLSLATGVGKLVCFYDANSFLREASGQMSVAELEPALNYCNYLVYGYAGIDPVNFKIRSLNIELTHNRSHYNKITTLRKNNPHIRILLSLGGDQDLNDEGVPDTKKYAELLENQAHRDAFKASVTAKLMKYGFDGLDLAWQFPKSQTPKKEGLRSTVKNWFGSPSSADNYKAQFAALIMELGSELKRKNKDLTLTMMPQANAQLFIDIAAIMPYVDFVNLGTYDFQTPQNDPSVADLPAPLYALEGQDPTHNVQYQVNYWLKYTDKAHKLNIGITSYGRAWKMTKNSGSEGYPPVRFTLGAAPAGKYTARPGLLSWPEVCDLLKQKNGEAGDSTKSSGMYVYQPASYTDTGVWVGYEDPTTAAIKTNFARNRGLGGVAFHDLSLDDFRGECSAKNYPILNSIRQNL